MGVIGYSLALVHAKYWRVRDKAGIGVMLKRKQIINAIESTKTGPICQIHLSFFHVYLFSCVGYTMFY